MILRRKENKIYAENKSVTKHSLKTNSNGKTLIKITLTGVGIFLLSKLLKGNNTTIEIEPNTNTNNMQTFFYAPTAFVEIRNDSQGSGYYKASRGGGTRSHNGIDLVVYQGESIYSPLDGIIVRITQPYADDSRYKGVVIKGTGDYTGYEVKLFYITPFVAAQEIVVGGQLLAAAQKISDKYNPNMINHIHIEVRKNGILTDPTPLFFLNT